MSKLQPGDIAACFYAGLRRVVTIIGEYEDSEGLYNRGNPLMRVDMNGTTRAVRRRDLLPVAKPDTADRRKPLTLDSVWGVPPASEASDDE